MVFVKRASEWGEESSPTPLRSPKLVISSKKPPWQRGSERAEERQPKSIG